MKLGLDPEADEPGIDFGASAMDEDRPEANTGEEDEVIDDGGLQGGGLHCGAAVFYHNGLATESLDERE